jgi:hypothetical protein
MLARVSTASSFLTAPALAESPATRFTSWGRLAAAATLALGAGFQLAAFIAEPRHDETVERLRWIAENPDRADLAKTLDLLAMPFLLGTALVYVLLSRERSRRLAYAAGILLACGMVGLTAIQGYEILEFKLAQEPGVDFVALADTVDEASPPMIAMFLLFIPGALFGLLSFTVALWRSCAVPRGAVLLIPVFIVVDIFLQQGLAGHLVSFIGACWIASAVLLAGRVRRDGLV